uniref:Uncharacterized protein n=1 Tax=Cacopsylla melanoneura TaxID=428564 RepID=A0A8D8Q9J9_9HEMI
MLQMLPNTSPTYLGYPSTPITLLRSCVSSRATRLRTMTSGHPLWSPPVSDKQCYTVWSSVWKPRRRKKMKKKERRRRTRRTCMIVVGENGRRKKRKRHFVLVVIAQM